LSSDVAPSACALPERELKSFLQGAVCIVGVGNRLKGDDGAGPAVIDRIAGRTGAHAIDAGVAPENYLEKIASLKPESVLLIDAVDFGESTGSVRLIEPSSLPGGAISSHALSLGMTAEYLSARVGAKVRLLGIQPVACSFDTGLSDTVAATVRSVADLLLRLGRPKTGRGD
jgi:hydrogenase 3 maturation protease